MSMITRAATNCPFFVAGGTLPQDASSYVRREADAEVLRLLESGVYCHILTPRQMGKSSLMVRTAADLRAAGGVTVLLDLTALGVNVSPEQWYRGQMRRMGRQLGREAAMEAHWQAAAARGLGAYQRWESVVTEFILPNCDGPVVIFVDEIDIVCSLPFSADEYFAGIRQLYNARADNPELRRLSFCLLGVVTPFELIQDPRHTPFNVGKQIELRDFSYEEVSASLGRGLITPERHAGMVSRLLRRVLYWTGGQPYLTQRLCEQLAADGGAIGEGDVDRWCRSLFFGRADRVAADDHLLFVRERLLRGGADPAAVLTAYRRMLRKSALLFGGAKGLNDAGEESPTTSALRLSGIARLAPDGTLLPRNRIYRAVFDDRWAASQMPEAEERRLKRAYRLGIVRTLIASGTVTAAVGGLATAMLANTRARTAEAETRRQLFVSDMNLAQRALEANNVSRTVQLLERHRSNPEEAGRFEWRYLWAQSHQAAETLPPQDGGLSTVRFGKDATEVLTIGMQDMAVRSFSRVGGALRERLPGIVPLPLAGATYLGGAFSPDGTRLIRYSDKWCEVADVSSGKVLYRHPVTKPLFYKIALSPDYRQFAVSDVSGRVTLRNASSGRVERTLLQGRMALLSAMLSPDGRYLVTAGMDGFLRLWDTASGVERWQMGIGKGGGRAIAFAPDGRTVFASSRAGAESGVHRFDTASGKAKPALAGNSSSIVAIAVSPAGDVLVTGGSDRTMRVWDLVTGAMRRQFRAEEAAVALAVSRDGRWLAAGSKAGGAALWRIDDGEKEKKAPPALVHPIYDIKTFPNDGKLCAATDSKHRLYVWDMTSRRTVFVTTPTQPPAMAISVSADGHRIVTGDTTNSFNPIRAVGHVTVYDAKTGRILTMASLRDDFIEDVALSPGGEWFAASSGKGLIAIWRTDTAQRVSTCHLSEQKHAGALAFSPDGKHLVAASKDGSAIYRIQPGKDEIETHRGGHVAGVSEIVFSKDGRHMATAGEDASIALWSLQNGVPTQSRMLFGHTESIYAATFTPDGKSLLTGGKDGIIRGWDVATFQEILALPRHPDGLAVNHLQFEPDSGCLLSTDSHGTTRVWADTAHETGRISGTGSGAQE